jgi:hypothetical protein
VRCRTTWVCIIRIDDNPLVVATFEGRGKAAKEGLKRRGNFKSKPMVNVYPGCVSWGSFCPGFSFVWQDGAVLFGITSGSWHFPIASAFSTR